MMDREAKLDEIFRRAEVVRRRQEENWTRLLGGATAALALALITMIGGFAGRGTEVHGTEVHGTALGAFLLGPEAGGYVLVALIAFALGIVLALLAQKHRQTKEHEGKKET